MMSGMDKHYGRGELGKQILALCIVGGVVLTIAVVPGVAQIMKMFNGRSAKDRFRIEQSLRGLTRRGYLTPSTKGSYMLTEKGRGYAQMSFFEKQVIPRVARWDKKWRVLMFDIPEEYAHIRREVSMLIREMGMMKIQNSVFASPFPCRKEIDKLAKHYDVGQYFVYLETEVISCHKELITFFHLK